MRRFRLNGLRVAGVGRDIRWGSAAHEEVRIATLCPKVLQIPRFLMQSTTRMGSSPAQAPSSAGGHAELQDTSATETPQPGASVPENGSDASRTTHGAATAVANTGTGILRPEPSCRKPSKGLQTGLSTSPPLSTDPELNRSAQPQTSSPLRQPIAATRAASSSMQGPRACKRKTVVAGLPQGEDDERPAKQARTDRNHTSSPMRSGSDYSGFYMPRTQPPTQHLRRLSKAALAAGQDDRAVHAARPSNPARHSPTLDGIDDCVRVAEPSRKDKGSPSVRIKNPQQGSNDIINLVEDSAVQAVNQQDGSDTPICPVVDLTVEADGPQEGPSDALTRFDDSSVGLGSATSSRSTGVRDFQRADQEEKPTPGVLGRGRQDSDANCHAHTRSPGEAYAIRSGGLGNGDAFTVSKPPGVKPAPELSGLCNGNQSPAPHEKVTESCCRMLAAATRFQPRALCESGNASSSNSGPESSSIRHSPRVCGASDLRGKVAVLERAADSLQAQAAALQDQATSLRRLCVKKPHNSPDTGLCQPVSESDDKNGGASSSLATDSAFSPSAGLHGAHVATHERDTQGSATAYAGDEEDEEDHEDWAIWYRAKHARRLAEPTPDDGICGSHVARVISQDDGKVSGVSEGPLSLRNTNANDQRFSHHSKAQDSKPTPKSAEELAAEALSRLPPEYRTSSSRLELLCEYVKMETPTTEDLLVDLLREESKRFVSGTFELSFRGQLTRAVHVEVRAARKRASARRHRKNRARNRGHIEK